MKPQNLIFEVIMSIGMLCLVAACSAGSSGDSGALSKTKFKTEATDSSCDLPNPDSNSKMPSICKIGQTVWFNEISRDVSISMLYADGFAQIQYNWYNTVKTEHVPLWKLTRTVASLGGFELGNIVWYSELNRNVSIYEIYADGCAQIKYDWYNTVKTERVTLSKLVKAYEK